MIGKSVRDWSASDEGDRMPKRLSLVVITLFIGCAIPLINPFQVAQAAVIDLDAELISQQVNQNLGTTKLGLVVQYENRLTGITNPLNYVTITITPDPDLNPHEPYMTTFPCGVFEINLPINVGFTDEYSIKIELADGRAVRFAGAGYVTNEESSVYYGEYDLQLQGGFDYVYELTFSSGSNLGAAAIYSTLIDGSERMNQIYGQFGLHPMMNVPTIWPHDGPSWFNPGKGMVPSEIYISSDYFSDSINDFHNSWQVGFDSVRHNWGHCLLYEARYNRGAANYVVINDGFWEECRASHNGIQDDISSKTAAFYDGFADVIAVLSDYYQRDDVFFTPSDYDPNMLGIPIELDSDTIDGVHFNSDDIPGIRGEFVEGCIAGFMWDIVQDSSFAALWTMLGYGARTIDGLWNQYELHHHDRMYSTDFQDKYTWPYDDGLEYALANDLLENNIGIYSYDGIPSVTDNEIEISSFELLGYNAPHKNMIPRKEQPILVRYVLTNTDSSPVNFDADHGYFYNVHQTNVNGETEYGNNKDLSDLHIAEGCSVILSDIFTPTTVDTYEIRPGWVDSHHEASPDSPWGKNEIKTHWKLYNSVWDEDFVINRWGNGVEPDWTTGDLNPNNGLDTWYPSRYQKNPANQNAVHQGLYCYGRVNGNVANPPPAVPVCSEQTTYDNNMDAIATSDDGDFRIVGLHLHLHYRQALGDGNDYFDVQYSDPQGNWVTFYRDTETTIGWGSVNNWNDGFWTKKNVNLPTEIFNSEESLRFRLLFHSTNNGAVSFGTFIQQFNLYIGTESILSMPYD